MDNSVKKLPAGEVKKRLLEGRLTFDSLDEETVLRLLDYETNIFVNDIGETKFYKMCLKALSKFADFEAKDVTEENISEMSESAYFLCFDKRQQRKWKRMLKKQERIKCIPEKKAGVPTRFLGRAAVLVLLVMWLYTGQNLVYSEYNPFLNGISRIRELFTIPYGETVKRGDDDIMFDGEIKKYVSYADLEEDLGTDILYPDRENPQFAVKNIWYIDNPDHSYVQIKFENIEMSVYLKDSPFEESCFETAPEPLGEGCCYWLSNDGYYQAIIFSEDITYSIVSPDEKLLRDFLITLR